jgi:membrane protease YdiL (CAAX protease family)
MTKIFAERDLAELGLRQDRWAVLDFAAGLTISFLMSAALFLALLGLGAIKINSFAWQTGAPADIFRNLLFTFLIFAFVGWSEELLSRGYHLQTIASGSNQFWGIFLSSAIFVYLHRFNNGFGFEYIIFLFASGLFFSYAYIKTGQLWLSMGLHAGWDFFVIVIFFGAPINDFHIFRLMDVQALYSIQTLGTALELLVILAGSRLIQKYALYRNKQILACNRRVAETA